MHATATIWSKHMIKFFHNREELGGLLLQPILWVVLFGVGMGALVGSVGGSDYMSFMLPGILALTALGGDAGAAHARWKDERMRRAADHDATGWLRETTSPLPVVFSPCGAKKRPTKEEKYRCETNLWVGPRPFY